MRGCASRRGVSGTRGRLRTRGASRALVRDADVQGDRPVPRRVQNLLPGAIAAVHVSVAIHVALCVSLVGSVNPRATTPRRVAAVTVAASPPVTAGREPARPPRTARRRTSPGRPASGRRRCRRRTRSGGGGGCRRPGAVRRHPVRIHADVRVRLGVTLPCARRRRADGEPGRRASGNRERHDERVRVPSPSGVNANAPAGCLAGDRHRRRRHGLGEQRQRHRRTGLDPPSPKSAGQQRLGHLMTQSDPKPALAWVYVVGLTFRTRPRAPRSSTERRVQREFGRDDALRGPRGVPPRRRRRRHAGHRGVRRGHAAPSRVNVGRTVRRTSR